MRRVKVPISEELLDACTVLNMYEKELLAMRFVQGKSVAEIAKHFEKVGGTVSPQASKALQRYEAWYRTSGKKVTRSFRGDVVDGELKGMKDRIVSMENKIGLWDEKEGASMKINELTKTDLRYKATKDPEQLVLYVMKYVLEDCQSIIPDIREFFPRRGILQVVKDIFRDRTLPSRLRFVEQDAFLFCSNLLNQGVRSVKFQRLFHRYDGSSLNPCCTKKYYGRECGLTLEYDPREKTNLICVIHGKTTYNSLRGLFSRKYSHYPCFVCKRMDHEESDLEYDNSENAFECPSCGLKMPVNGPKLEEFGTTRRKLAEETRPHWSIQDYMAERRRLVDGEMHRRDLSWQMVRAFFYTLAEGRREMAKPTQQPSNMTDRLVGLLAPELREDPEHLARVRTLLEG